MNTATAEKLDDDVLLTPKEACKVLKVSYATLAAWRVSGRHADSLPFIKVGHGVRYRKSVLDRFLETQERQHT